MFENFEPLIKLPQAESDEFARFIQKTRKAVIPSPKNTAKRATEKNQKLIDAFLNKGKISDAVVALRELSYDEFLKDEAKFNGIVLSQIDKKFNAPKHLLAQVSSKLHELSHASKIEFQEKTSQYFGEYAGAISPYIYQLCLSNTQSRRSRAGKTFEGIIYYLYEYFGYPYDAQSIIGKKHFQNWGWARLWIRFCPVRKHSLNAAKKQLSVL